MITPTSSADFDRAYHYPITVWGDLRVPQEIQALARQGSPGRALELGCGLGRFSRHLAQHGVQMTGVDFSPVAIARAKEKAAGDPHPPHYLVGDVTQLDTVSGPFDFAFDVGCFHCLDPEARRCYVTEVHRVLAPGATHLLWALDSAPSDLKFSPELVQTTFAPAFTLRKAKPSRRRIARSHWYWLERA